MKKQIYNKKIKLWILKQTQGNKRGFTLVELLIAITIFMVLLTISANSFLSIVRTQSSANEIRQTYSDLRSFIDLINNEMRGGSIDYLCYGSSRNNILSSSYRRCEDATSGFNGSALRVISADGLTSSIIFTKVDSGNNTNKKSYHVFLRRWKNIDGIWSPDIGFANPGGAKKILFNNVQIKKLTFNILPKVRPSNVISLVNTIQPMVEVNLQVKGTNNFKMDFQTLITSRTYNQ